jgi:hypothetical protein
MSRNRKEYTDVEKAMFLLALEANGGNLSATHRETGVPISTLSRWNQGEAINGDVPKIGNEKRGDLVKFLRELAWQLAEAIPGKIEDATLAQTSTSMGIVIDKAQLLSGQPTDIIAIRESIQGAIDNWIETMRSADSTREWTLADAVTALDGQPGFENMRDVLEVKTVQ